MKIIEIGLGNFMGIRGWTALWTDVSKDINVISGASSSGKTTLLKVMYATVKSFGTQDSREGLEESIKNNLLEVFKPSGNNLDKLRYREYTDESPEIRLNLKGINKIVYRLYYRDKYIRA